MNKIEKDQNKWKYISCSWIERHIDKISISLNVIYRFSAVSMKKNLNGIFYRNCENNPTAHIELKKTQNSQSNLEKEQIWKHHTPWFQSIIQSDSNGNSIILTSRYRPMKVNKEPRNKPTHVQSPKAW